MYRRTLPRVARVLLERKAEDGDLFAADGVEKRLDDFRGKPGFLVFVHVDHLLPVCSNFG